MAKESSYQKLKRLHKEKVEQLEFDIRALRGKEGEGNKMVVEARYVLREDFQDVVWYGSSTDESELKTFKGIIQ